MALCRPYRAVARVFLEGTTMIGAGVILVLVGVGLQIAGQMWGLAAVAAGVALLIVSDGDGPGGGA
jgi:hypothetical protein